MEIEENSKQIIDEEEFKEDNENFYDKYDEYDENNVSVTNYRPLNNKKGKGKILKKKSYEESHVEFLPVPCPADCKCPKCMLQNKCEKKFLETNLLSLFDYSNILKNYNNISEILHNIYFNSFYIDKRYKINLIYQLNENKNSIKNFIKTIKNNNPKDLVSKLIIMKISFGIYCAFLTSKDYRLTGYLYFFTTKDLIHFYPYNLYFNIIEKENEKIELLSKDLWGDNKNETDEIFFILSNSFNNGIFKKEIKFKNRTIKTNTCFSILEFEYFHIVKN